MNKANEKSKTGVLDLSAFEKSLQIDVYSIPSLILKLKTSKYFMTLPDWIERYPIPPGTVECPESAVKCMSHLVKLQKSKAFNVHPVHQLDLVTSTLDVVVEPKGVGYVEDGKAKSLSVVVGYLVPDPNDAKRLIHASTADITSTDAKFDKKFNLTKPEWPENFGVPLSDATKVRLATESTVPSRSKARDEIFAFLTDVKNNIPGIRLHSVLGDKLKNFTKHPVLTRGMITYYNKIHVPVPPNLEIKVIGVDNSPVVYAEDIATAYKYYFKSVSVRGGRDGKNVAHGFERFSMSRTMANTLNLVLDFMNMANLYNCGTFMIRDTTYLTTEQIRVLIHNKFRVIHLESMHPPCEVASPPGIYGSIGKDVEVVEFLVFPDSLIKPEMVNQVVSLGKMYDNALQQLSRKRRCFAMLYIDQRMTSYSQTISFLPSATADTMQVIAATDVSRSFEIKDLVKRATMAISCRNRFVHTRKAFCTMDSMNSFVNWSNRIYYPKLRVLEEKKFLSLEKVEVANKIEFEPIGINEKDFLNDVEQAVPIKMDKKALMAKAIKQYPDFFLRVYIGEQESDRFKYVADYEQAWDSDFDSVISLPEKQFLTLLGSISSDWVDRYNEISAELIGDDDDSGDVGDRRVDAVPPVHEDEIPPEINLDEEIEGLFMASLTNREEK